MIGKIGADLAAQAKGKIDVDVSMQAGLAAAVDVAASALSDTDAAPDFAVSVLTDLGGAPARPGPVGTRSPDPWSVFRFKVEIKGIGMLRFQKVGAIAVKSKPDNVQTGGKPGTGSMLPPRQWDWDPLTLTKGMAVDAAPLWQWVMETVTKRPIKTHDITVILLDSDGKPGMTWTFLDAYPTTWSIVPSGMDAGSATIAIDTITFAHQGVDLQIGSGPTYHTPPPAPEAPPPASQPPKPNAPAQGAPKPGGSGQGPGGQSSGSGSGPSQGPGGKGTSPAQGGGGQAPSSGQGSGGQTPGSGQQPGGDAPSQPAADQSGGASQP